MNIKAILLLGFFCFSTSGISQEYDFKAYSLPEGLAQPYVYSIIQDQRGYLWIGTPDGLSMYDGFRIRTFTTSDSLADNFITSAINDGKNLWFGHRSGRITFYDGKVFRPVPDKSGNISPITHFTKDPGGKVWGSSLSGNLFKLENGEIIIEGAIPDGCQPLYTFEFLGDNDLLAGCETGLISLKPAKSSGKYEIESVKEIPDVKITGIVRMRKSPGFLVATENDGIFKLNNENNSYRVEKIVTDPESEFSQIQNLLEDYQGNIWIGSFRTGLLKLAISSGTNYRLSEYNKISGFATDNAKTVFEDREGNIWCGSYGDGLIQITPRVFRILRFDKYKYGNSVFSICSDENSMWLGTEKGLLRVDPLKGVVYNFYSKGSGLPKDTVTAIQITGGNKLWIGTFGSGLFSMNTQSGQITRYPLSKGILENSITAIAGNGGQIWVGTKRGLCSITSDTEEPVWYTINQGGLPHNYVTGLYLDKKKRLWVSTNTNILTYIDNGKVNGIPVYSGSGILTLGSVTEDAESGIWVESRGKGVYVLKSDSVFCLSANEGLFSDYCYSIACDSDQNIWIGHKNGMSSIKSTDFSIKTIKQIYGISDEFQLYSNSIQVEKNKCIAFGSDKGLIIYNPSVEAPFHLAPVVSLTSVKINDEEKSFENNEIVLPSGTYKLRIDFFGVSLREPEQVTYRYRLEGYDKSMEITKNTTVTYDHLTYGKYVFILKASAGNGIVSQNPVKLTLIIRQPLWKKWWFWISSTALIGLVLYLNTKWRLAKLLAEKRMLEEKVNERTKEIQLQKNEIEAQRDMIELKNISITSSINYASKIQQAVLPPAELLDKLLPDSFIFSKPKDIVSGDFYWLAERDERIIFTIADCTGHGVPGAFMSLLGISFLNEIVKVHGIIRSDAILSALYEKLVQSILQDRKENITKDGMDIALCVLDRRKRRIQYSGGMNDLVKINNGRMVVIKSDRTGLGPSDNTNGRFSLNELDYEDSDMIYLFSDGYQDQFGGINNKKFLRSRFYNTLFEISSLPVSDQKDVLETTLNWWMGDKIQTDDITVLGVRLH